MSITDELRHNIEGAEQLYGCECKHLLAIADRIDAEHQKACDDAWDNGYEADYLGIEKWLTEHPQVMEHHGWIRLPKDADGEYIHVGDEMCGYGKTIEVVELRYGRSGWVLISRDGNGYADTFAFTHYHAPTVEDVLREFAYGLGVPVADSYIAASAAKLRLAIKVVGFTDPEQAIAATLGATDAKPTQVESSGTCHITDNGPWGYPYVCSACGASFDPDVNNGEFNYCPNCGRRIEQ